LKSNLILRRAIYVIGDPVRLQQVIWNLLTNAIKFSPPSSKIDIFLTEDISQVPTIAEIKIKDYGKGISSEFLPFVFTQFSQADSSSIRVHGGLGLGLSIVKNLVELQNGKVKVENNLNEPGTTFTLNFPLVDAVAFTTLTEQNETKPSIKIPSIPTHEPKKLLNKGSLNDVKILLVDDDENTRDALVNFLQTYGAIVESAESAVTALRKIELFKPNILISDIAMPNEDGYSLIRKIRGLESSRFKDIPAIALTAFAANEDAQKALASGFQTHLSKPVDSSDLINAILKLTQNQLSH
jgi:CheY-like chemotaxis protein